ncbi:MAG TPA: MmgE/PrpD family protein [Candidatus Binatus sp.]|nr:MmgE/PrpD family protein [Candidatus Binatus sp.]
MSDALHQSIDGLSRKLAEFAQDFVLEQAPALVVGNAKQAILDCLGVSVLATRQEIGVCLDKFAKAHVSAGNCTVWGMALRASVRDAAFLNGTLAHGLDYDDRNHSTTYTLATAIATAESVEANGRQALEAFIIGREVRATLDRIFSARSSGIGPGARGWHSNGILGPIAAACSASRIYRLDSKQTLAAIGLSAGACGALTRDGGTMAKPFRCGHAAATGVTSALLAQAGFSSDETVLEGRYGLLEAVGPLNDEILASLGKNVGVEWDLAHSLRIKPFASCTATQSGLEAMLRLRQREAIAADDVAAIECDLRPYPLVRAQPSRGYEGRFSMPFCLAMTLVHGTVKPHDFVDERLQDPRIQNLIQRTRHVKADSLTVILKGGQQFSEPFQPIRNLTDLAQVRDKFAASVCETFTKQRTKNIVDHVSRLENLDSVRQLTSLLANA